MALEGTFKTIGVTGHRPADFDTVRSEWTRAELRRTLTQLRDEHGATELNDGMAAGTDLWAATAALGLGYRLHAYLPFAAEDQRLRWPSATKRLHLMTLARAATYEVAVELPPPGNHAATSAAMLRGYTIRNEALVHDADLIVAVWSGRRHGGTAHALRCAVLEGKPIILLSLRSMTTVVPGREALADRLGVTLPVPA